MEPFYRYGDLVAWAPALALLLVTALVSFSRIFERNPPTMGLLLAVVLWCWADATHGFVVDPSLKMLLFYLQFGFLGFIPVTWLGTCFRLTGQSNRWTAGVTATLGAFALVMLGVLASDPHTHWVFRALELPPGASTFYRQNGVGYYAFIAVLFSSLAVGVILLIRSRASFSILDLKRSALVLWGVIVPTAAGLVDALRLWPEPRIDLVPWALFVTAALFLWAIGRGRLFAPVALAYEIVVKEMSDPVVVMDSSQRPVWFNNAARELWPEAGPSHRLSDVFPGLAGHLPTLRAGGEVTIDHGGRQFRVKGAPAQDPRSGFESLAFVFHDITSLKVEQNRLEALVADRTALLHETNRRLESELEKSRDAQTRLEGVVSEKNLLVQEVNHRVKNNLQIILSLIGLQTRRLPSGSAALEVFAATHGRIRSIGLVHDLIYRAGSGNGLDLGIYLEELVRGIGALYDQQGTRIEILLGSEADASPRTFRVDVDFCVDFGLVVNELVTNALKYGLVPSGGGLVSVGLGLRGEQLVVSVRDSGPGFVPSEGASTSLGLSLVRSVSAKYHAEVRFVPGAQTLVEVSFPWKDPLDQRADRR